MLSTSKYNDGSCNKSFGITTEKKRTFTEIASVLPDCAIYTKVRQNHVAGKGTGFNEIDNLLTADEALNWIDEGGNVGIVLGRWIDGHTYINFDIENEDAIDDKTRSIIDNHAVLRFLTKHKNLNRVLRIDEKETYNLLRSYGESHNHLSDDDRDDLEIITKGHAVIPPSEYNHKYCSEEKPCDQEDRISSYLLDWVQDGQALSYDTVGQIGELLELESDDTDNSTELFTTSNEELDNVPSVEPETNVLTEFDENVPSVYHSFDDRKDRMLEEDWKGQQQFIQLCKGDFSSVAGSQKQAKAECKIANTIGFFFGRNEEIIKFFMSSLAFETQYETNDSHRKQLLQWATNVDWVYCEGVSFIAKSNVAFAIQTTGAKTVSEIQTWTEIDKRQIRNVIDVLECEGKITTTNGKHGQREIIDNQITDGWLKKMDRVIRKYDGYSSQSTVEESDCSEVAIVRI